MPSRQRVDLPGALKSSCRSFRSTHIICRKHGLWTSSSSFSTAATHDVDPNATRQSRRTRRCTANRSALGVGVSRQSQRSIYTEVNGKLVRETQVFDTLIQPIPDPPGKLPAAPNVAVLGAGITGLATAFYLAKELPPRAKITIYEEDTRVGGWIQSDRKKFGDAEFILEKGPRLLSTAETGNRLDRMVAYDLMTSTGITPRSTPKKLQRWIWHDEMLLNVPPSSLSDLLQSPLFLQIAPVALFNYFRNVKLQQGRDKVEGRGDQLSIAEWIQAIFGSRKMADVPLSAFIHGIWGGDARKLSAASVIGTYNTGIWLTPPDPGFSAFPCKEAAFFTNFVQPDEDLLRIYKTVDDKQVCMPEHGLHSLPQALADTLKMDPKINLQIGNGARSLTRNRPKGKIMIKDSKDNVEGYDKVISTLPAHALSKITHQKLPTLDELQAVSIMTVNFWYPKSNLVPNGLGYLIPRSTPADKNPEHALGVFFDSECIPYENESPSMGDERPTKLFVLMGGHYYEGKQPPTEDEAIEQAKNLLERQLGIPRDEPCFATARLADKCLPQHHVGHAARMALLDDEILDTFDNRLAVAGGSYNRPGVAGGLRAAWDIAHQVSNVDFLSNGLEDLVPEKVEKTGWCLVSHEHDACKSAQRTSRKDAAATGTKAEG